MPPRCHLTRFRFQDDPCSLTHLQTVLRVHEQGLLERCPADFVVSAMDMTAIAPTGPPTGWPGSRSSTMATGSSLGVTATSSGECAKRMGSAPWAGPAGALVSETVARGIFPRTDALQIPSPAVAKAGLLLSRGLPKKKGRRRGQPEVDMNKAESFTISPLPQRHSEIVVSSAENRRSP